MGPSSVALNGPLSVSETVQPDQFGLTNRKNLGVAPTG